MITSLAIILMPLLLTSIALLVVGSQIEDAETQFGFPNNSSFIYTIENYSRITEEVLEKVRQQIAEDSSRMEDKAYLDEISESLADKSSYIIVRKNGSLYYTGNHTAAKKIFSALPDYGSEIDSPEAGYYYNDIKKLVKEAKCFFC